jgi:hypothetical protein
MAQADVFASQFDRYRVQEWLKLTPEERSRRLARARERGRWFDAVKVLRTEAGLPEESLRRLAQLPPSGRARVLFELRSTEDVPPDDRRLRLVRLIDELHGRAALSDAPVPPLQRVRAR